MEDKAEAFVEGLLGDVFGCFAEAMNLDIEYMPEQDGTRVVPEDFYCEMISFSKVFVDELMPDIANMPVLLYYSDDFFRRFTTSVCLKLIADDDPEVAFLKVFAFLLVIISSSFVNRCYRSLDYLPEILRKLLKDHLKTNFYEEGRFNDIASQCDELKDEEWYDSTVEEMRRHMKDALNTELSATKIPYIDFHPDRTKIRIIDVRSQRDSNTSTSDCRLCPYCAAECFFFLKVFWKPKIMYKPDCQQM